MSLIENFHRLPERRGKKYYHMQTIFQIQKLSFESFLSFDVFYFSIKRIRYRCVFLIWGVYYYTTDDDDVPKSRRSLEEQTEDINKVKDYLLTDRRVKILVLANKMELSEGGVLKILHDDLGLMIGLSVSWIQDTNKKMCRRQIC